MEFLEFNESSIHFIKYFSDFEELAFLTAPFIKEGNIAISGGNTYKKLFKYWVDFKKGIGNAVFYPVDERKVSFESDDSNWGTAYRCFLSKIGREEDKNNFAVSEDSYKKLLNEKIGDNPVFDCIYLGVGDDGHTASLFPDTEELKDLKSLVLETESPKPPVKRITLGFSIIKNAKQLIVVISGNNKKNIFKRILTNDDSLPIVKLLNLCSNAIILADKNLIDD